MTITQMFGQSGLVALMGVGTVFGFLVFLVICITLMGKLVQALGLNKPAQAAKVPAAKSAAAAKGGADNEAITAAITSAVAEYRKTH
jgi:oxaloacetate decarboxylase gamma subunit